MWKTSQVHESDQLSLPSTHHSFVASGRCVEPDAPAVELNGGKGDQWISWTKPFVQGWTHTHIHTHIHTHTPHSHTRTHSPTHSFTHSLTHNHRHHHHDLHWTRPISRLSAATPLDLTHTIWGLLPGYFFAELSGSGALQTDLWDEQRVYG